MTVEVRVDHDLCIGCGMCMGIAPHVFQLNSSGKADAVSGVEADGRDAVQEAIDTCPTAAISWAE